MAVITLTITDTSDTIGVDGEPTVVTVAAADAVQSVVAGTNVTVDSTDPLNPVISAAGGVGGGAVDSVNGETGTVVLSAADVGADAAGAAATAQTTAEGYTDTAITSEVTRANAAYDATGAAASAQSASQPVDSDLTAIAALTTTGYGRAVLALADQAALMALLSSSSTTAQGIVELATSAEALTGTDTVRAVTPAALQAKIDALVNSAPGLLDTLGEIATQLSTDETAVSALTTTVAGKLAKASNLSDLASASTARTNLGLGSAALSASTDFQPVDSDLTAVAALTTTAYGRAFLELANQAALMALLSASTTSAAGIVELATSAETTTGTDAVRAVTPAGLAAVTVLLATLASPTFTGTVTIPTATAADSSTKAASTAFVQGELTAKAPLASPALTGNPTAPTPSAADNDTSIATTAFVQGEIAAKAPLASPTFTGHPVGVTETAGNNSTRLASTAYADNAVAKQSEVLIFALGDETTAITTGLKVTFRMPFAMTLTSVRASLTTASSSGVPAVNIKESGTTIFSTTLTIDATELTSTTAATAAVLSDTSLADDAEMTFIVDTAGTGAKGLKVTLIGTRT